MTTKFFTLFALLIFISPLFGQKEMLRQREMQRHLRKSPAISLQNTPNQSLYDVHMYSLDLELLPEQQLLDGRVTIGATSLDDALDRVELDLHQNMQVLGITSPAGPLEFQLEFQHNNDILTVTLERPYANQENFEFEIIYRGNPQSSGFGSFNWSTHGPEQEHMIWTLSEPYGARDWWPCKDYPTDKADSVFLRIRVPYNLVVASNGLLTSVSSAVDSSTKTYSWRTNYPIPTYLVSLAITDYEVFSDWYDNGAQDMEVQYYVYPEQLAEAQIDLDVTVEMIEFFASVFGEYPFIEEKYGMASFQWGGAMEHQTITSYGAGLLQGNHRYDYINAHELAHQWFGDCITMRHWSHIWLNEGFASYAEALWQEHLGGKPAYDVYMQSQHREEFPGSLFVTDSLLVWRLFSVTSYDKGSWVLHMLRGVLGDAIFFDCIKAYATDPDLIYKAAITEDFQRVCENVSGMDLDWFFSQWIYREGRPYYQVGWKSSSREPYSTTIHIRQTNLPAYKMPLQIAISGIDQDTTITVWNETPEQLLQVSTDFEPFTLAFDPDNWVLKQAEVTPGGIPDHFQVWQNYPNPFNATTQFQYYLPRSSRVIISIFNSVGQKIATPLNSSLPEGLHQISWQADGFPSGLYFYQIVTDFDAQTKKMLLLK
jgi:aminopeptidase N